jgi:error-prone DNA polymerase
VTASPPYAELHCHSNFSFLDGASSADDLVERAVELGLSALAVTDHQGLYGAVRFAIAADEAGIKPIIGLEVELLDSAIPDPRGIVVPRRRPVRRAAKGVLPGGRRSDLRSDGSFAPDSLRPPRSTPGHPSSWSTQESPIAGGSARAVAGVPEVPRAERLRLPGHRDPVREDLRGIGDRERGPHLVLLAVDGTGYRSLCRIVSAAQLAGTKGVPRFDQALLAKHTEGLVALSACRHGEIARRLLADDRRGAAEVARRYASLFPQLRGLGGFFLELQHHLLPDDDWLVGETARLAAELGLPAVVTNDAHYARREDRELQDVLIAIRHGATLDETAHLRRANGEFHLKSGAELAALPPGAPDADQVVARSWAEGLRTAGELAARCRIDLDFDRYRFPGFPVPQGETAFSYLERLCHEGARRLYHPMTPDVLKQLAHELEVIERTGLAEFFLICWDLMRFSKERGIPAQGRGSAGDSIVAYALGITRVDPIRHGLLFERFINEGRATYPDVDIDFAASRREEVIQYVYERYGAEHTGMVCNVVTYRARSAVREVGSALGFPRPLVDRVAKALETYDSVMVRRDLEAEGGFAEFFESPAVAMAPEEHDPTAAIRHESTRAAADLMALASPEAIPASRATQAARTAARLARDEGFVDRMGQLNHRQGGRRGGTASEPGSPGRIVPPVDDEGGPGDSAASVAWLRRDGETPMAGSEDPERNAASTSGPVLQRLARHGSHSSVARVELEPPPQRRAGSTVGMSPWERWLELCARIDGFPRHLSIHSGGMLITQAPLVDIAPLERATMPGRVVIQYDKRDVETIKLIKLDLLGLRMLSAIDDAIRDIQADCGVYVDLDRLPEDLPEVFRMIQAADTVGVFQIESRAQMQTLPRSQPQNLDDLVVEVAIIRPGPIQGNAVHPYLRRKQGKEPVRYLHPSLEPILAETLGVILYQEQVMKIAIDVAGFTPADSDGFRRAMGTWRSTREMEKLHGRFVEGCRTANGLTEEQAEELFRQVAGFASFGFNKSHAAAFARTAYESAFLKLYYPAQLVCGLINAQPMGFYPVEVLINDAKRHGVAVLPVDVNRSLYATRTEWAGMPGTPLPDGAGIVRRPTIVRSSGCVVPSAESRRRLAADSSRGYGIRLGLHLVKGIGEEHADALDAERMRGPYRSLADVVTRTGLSEEVIERLIRAGALDSFGRPRRELLWELREVAGSSRPRTGAAARIPVAGRPLDLHLPPTTAPDLPPPTELERLGDSYAILSLDARRQVVELFRPALDRLGALPAARLVDQRPGAVAIGGLVVTRQHPMTARGTVFLALEDETGMVNVTLWPDVWARLRGIVRRHALLYVEGTLQRESEVVNLVARRIEPLSEVARSRGGPDAPAGVHQLGHAGMRRVG